MSIPCKLSAGLGFCGLLVAASIAAAQVSVNAPPPGTAGPTNVQAGGVNVQTAPGGGTSVTIPPGAAGAVGQRIRDNAAARQENRLERRAETNNDWRMVRHNNQWWYWNPNNSWSVYRNNAWGPYGANDGMQSNNYYSGRRPLGFRRWTSAYRGVNQSGMPPMNNSMPSTNAPSNTAPANPAPATP